MAPSRDVVSLSSRINWVVSGMVWLASISTPGWALPARASTLASVALALVTVRRKSAASGRRSESISACPEPASASMRCRVAVAAVIVVRASANAVARSGAPLASAAVATSVFFKMPANASRFSSFSTSFSRLVRRDTFDSTSGAVASRSFRPPVRGGMTGAPSGPGSVIGLAP